jgi:hypothetical protein
MASVFSIFRIFAVGNSLEVVMEVNVIQMVAILFANFSVFNIG